MTDLSPDQVPEGWTNLAAMYDEEFAPFTRKYAIDAADLTGVHRGSRVLDVAAGTGAFSFEAARRGATVLATDFAPGMIEQLKRLAKANGYGNVTARLMDGQNLDVEDESFDVAASQLGLMFFPDRAAGFRELFRALVPGGHGVVTAWGPPERLAFLAPIMGAFARGIPGFEPPDKPPTWAALADRNVLAEEMKAAGFSLVNVHTLSHLWVVPDPAATFDKLATLAPPLAHLFASLDEVTLGNVKTAYLDIFREQMGAGPYGLSAEANVAVGVK